MVDIGFSLKTPTGGPAKLRRVLNAAILGISDAFGKGLIEKFLLKRTLERFEPRGANAGAQKNPQGKPWARLKPSTLRRRRSNRGASSQALVDTGKLRGSIVIFNKKTGKAALASGRAGFSLGIRPGSEVHDYGLFQNRGGTNKEGHRVPRRQFLGIGKRDIRPLTNILKVAILARVARVL